MHRTFPVLMLVLGFVAGTSVAVAYAAGGIDMFADVFIDGTLTVQDGTEGFGKVFTSDGAGTGSWQISPVDGDSDPTNELQTLTNILRFRGTSVQSVFTTLGPHQMTGIDGQLTKFIFRFDVGSASVPPIPVMATVFVNDSPTALTCDVLAVKNTIVTCVADTPVPVISTDLITVGTQFIPGGPIVNQIGNSVHATIQLTQ